MKERFEGTAHANLIDALKRLEFVNGNIDIASGIAERGELVEYAKGDKIIVQDAEDNDFYILLAGSAAIVVKGNQVATRKAGQYVGEMAAIEPAQKRAATVVALGTVVAVRLSSIDFSSIGETYPQIWLPIARELSRRLYQRNDLIPAPNEAPKLLIISSTEALDVAREIQSQLQYDVFSRVWNEGVFFAGGYSLEALEKAVDESDFAIAVAQADDIVESRGIRHQTLRDNVLFELGLFMGKLTRYRTILVHPRAVGLKLPSDLLGLTAASYQPGSPDELASLLGPACNEIRKIVRDLGVRTLTA